MNNVLNELNKLSKRQWADYGIISDILDRNGLEWNDIDDKFGDYLESILNGDDIENILSNRIEDNESYLEFEDTDDGVIDIIKQSIKEDANDIKYYNRLDGALYQYCEGGDFEFYRLTNEDVVMMLSSLA